MSFAEPQVIYRETIREAAEGFVAYTMPKPCWAIIKFLIEPAPRGSGVSYRSEVPVRVIKERYQHQIEQGLTLGLRQGMLGWQVDDISITLIDGSDHQWNTHPLDFINSTLVSAELVKTLIGSFSLVLVAPFTAFTASIVFAPRKERE